MNRWTISHLRKTSHKLWNDFSTVTTFNWVFEYQLIATEILTQPSRYNRAKSNLLADGKGLRQEVF